MYMQVISQAKDKGREGGYYLQNTFIDSTNTTFSTSLLYNILVVTFKSMSKSKGLMMLI